MKRETSVSVTDLQERECKELSDCVKRLALRGSLSLPSAPASPVSATRTPLSSGASTPHLSPVVSLAGSESPEHLSSSGASYASTELLSRPLPSQPIAPLFHPSLVPLMPSPTTSAAAPIITANGRTFSQGGTVLDTVCARDAFDNRYELGGEIGRGGFSVVHQCRHRQSQRDYAVKIVDLRPLRLRERFNPARLRREIDIMKKLRHPSIVEFIDGFETESQLLMVMELCPGQELFDVILARQCFSEADAKPIFSQVANAIYYLHCLNIIHRDVKPENILILDQPDERGLPVAKLLDFGLSKNAGAGSAAKTFVGTPCYLAPEVEFTAKGLGGTYVRPDSLSLSLSLSCTISHLVTNPHSHSHSHPFYYSLIKFHARAATACRQTAGPSGQCSTSCSSRVSPSSSTTQSPTASFSSCRNNSGLMSAERHRIWCDPS